MSTTTQQSATSASTPSFVTAIVLNGAIFLIEVGVFTLIRRKFPVIYEPRTFIPAEDKRSKPLPNSLLGWPRGIYDADYKDIAHQNGLDAYFFVRFLRFMTKILLPIWLISWAVLLPIDAAGHTADLTGLDMFTFGNVYKGQQARYAAHLVLAFGFTIWILYSMKAEYAHFITTRQLFLVDPDHSSSAQANTVLITGIPRRYLDEAILKQLFSHLPGGVKKVWLNRDLKELPKAAKRRTKALNKLEASETKLLSIAAKLKRKGVLKKPDSPTHSHDNLDPENDPNLCAKLVPKALRPTHRLPLGFMPFSLPLVGTKVDSIEWAKSEIAASQAELDQAAENLRADATKEGTGEAEHYPPLNSAFILFHQQIAAHLAQQITLHHEPYRMAQAHTEVAPDDVIWGNLSMNPYEQKIRMAISYALTAGLIIVWAIPVAFVGIISNVHALCATYSWLHWLCTLPSAVVGIISGILPPVFLAILMMLLPIVLRLMARFEGIPRKTGLELSLMTRFFSFLVVHGFLIVTLSSGIIAALPQLVNNPSSVPNLLAQNLPKASTFFLTYAILQGLAGTAASLIQAVPLILYYVKLFLMGSTPRSIYQVKFELRSVDAWGTLFPTITLLMVITIGYSIISPIINGLAFASFFLFYQTWKYLFLYQLDQPPSGDTGGLFFPKALQHVFVGLYVQQVCLCALFFLARDLNGKASAIPEGALMVLLIICTAGYQLILNNSYNPLIKNLPLTLAHKSYGMPHEETPRPSTDGETDGDPGEEPAIQPRDRKVAGDIEKPRGDIEEGTSTPPPVMIEEPTDFNPPALRPARCVWIPKDSLGLGDVEGRSLEADGIKASTVNATMDEKGKVEIQGPPPEPSD